MRAFFVTGTDTGVGKTTVGAALLAAASRRGLRTACMKPVESGCERAADGQLTPSDAMALRASSNMDQALEDVCQYRFEQPVAPGVAARRSGVVIEFRVISQAFERVRSQEPDMVLVEGAGGLLVPFTDDQVTADLVVTLGIPLIVVARPGLGTINHTLLTLEAAEARGLDVAGIIISCLHDGIPAAQIASNVEEIGRYHRAPYLGCLPYLPRPTPDVLVQAGARLLNRLV